MKFFVVEYIQPVATPSGEIDRVGYRLFDFDYAQREAEAFCKEQKEFGNPVNIRIRDIDVSLLQ